MPRGSANRHERKTNEREPKDKTGQPKQDKAIGPPRTCGSCGHRSVPRHDPLRTFRVGALRPCSPTWAPLSAIFRVGALRPCSPSWAPLGATFRVGALRPCSPSWAPLGATFRVGALRPCLPSWASLGATFHVGTLRCHAHPHGHPSVPHSGLVPFGAMLTLMGTPRCHIPGWCPSTPHSSLNVKKWKKYYAFMPCQWIPPALANQPRSTSRRSRGHKQSHL